MITSLYCGISSFVGFEFFAFDFTGRKTAVSLKVASVSQGPVKSKSFRPDARLKNHFLIKLHTLRASAFDLKTHDRLSLLISDSSSHSARQNFLYSYPLFLGKLFSGAPAP
jgi:hypothetical protein